MKFDVEKIRQDFPLLNKSLKGRSYVYFDNACMSLRPKSVLDAQEEYYKNESSCAGRSLHKLSEDVNRRIEQTRKLIAGFIGARSEKEIIFTKNTTEGLNMVARGFNFKEGDKVLTTDKEHNSNLVPWLILQKEKGIIHHVVPSKEQNVFDLVEFEKIVEQERPIMISVGATSNLDGVSVPIREIIRIGHKYGSYVMLDGAQAVPHFKINVKDLDVDFLAFSAHKMLAPTGLGVLYGKLELLEKLKPLMAGGGNMKNSTYEDFEFADVPYKFEAGLQNYSAIYGLSEAIIYLEKVGFDNINRQELIINKFITDAVSEWHNVKIIGPIDSGLRSGIFSFYVDGFDVREIALMLDQLSNVAVRSGQHCVHSWFNSHHIAGSVRASFYFYNTIDEAKVFVETLERVLALRR